MDSHTNTLIFDDLFPCPCAINFITSDHTEEKRSKKKLFYKIRELRSELPVPLIIVIRKYQYRMSKDAAAREFFPDPFEWLNRKILRYRFESLLSLIENNS